MQLPSQMESPERPAMWIPRKPENALFACFTRQNGGISSPHGGLLSVTMLTRMASATQYRFPQHPPNHRQLLARRRGTADNSAQGI